MSKSVRGREQGSVPQSAARDSRESRKVKMAAAASGDRGTAKLPIAEGIHAEKITLQRKHSYVADKLPCHDVAPLMYSSGLLTDREHASYKSMRDVADFEKAEYLLGCLQRREPGFLRKFCDILLQIQGAQHIARVLDEEYKQVLTGLKGEKLKLRRHGHHDYKRKKVSVEQWKQKCAVLQEKHNEILEKKDSEIQRLKAQKKFLEDIIQVSRKQLEMSESVESLAFSPPGVGNPNHTAADGLGLNLIPGLMTRQANTNLYSHDISESTDSLELSSEPQSQKLSRRRWPPSDLTGSYDSLSTPLSSQVGSQDSLNTMQANSTDHSSRPSSTSLESLAAGSQFQGMENPLIFQRTSPSLKYAAKTSVGNQIPPLVAYSPSPEITGNECETPRPSVEGNMGSEHVFKFDSEEVSTTTSEISIETPSVRGTWITPETECGAAVGSATPPAQLHGVGVTKESQKAEVKPLPSSSSVIHEKSTLRRQSESAETPVVKQPPKPVAHAYKHLYSLSENPILGTWLAEQQQKVEENTASEVLQKVSTPASVLTGEKQIPLSDEEKVTTSCIPLPLQFATRKGGRKIQHQTQSHIIGGRKPIANRGRSQTHEPRLFLLQDPDFTARLDIQHQRAESNTPSEAFQELERMRSQHAMSQGSRRSRSRTVDVPPGRLQLKERKATTLPPSLHVHPSAVCPPSPPGEDKPDHEDETLVDGSSSHVQARPHPEELDTKKTQTTDKLKQTAEKTGEHPHQEGMDPRLAEFLAKQKKKADEGKPGEAFQKLEDRIHRS